MLQIHPNARTTPAVRAEIARSGEPTGVLARRFGVSTETVRQWRKRGPEDCLDHSAKPHKLPWKATEEERAVVCALRRATNFALDDLTFTVTHFLPHLNRDSIWRILRAEGLSRRPPPPSARPKRGQGEFRDYDLGFIHIDIKHLPKLQTADGERRKRYLYVAIDRCSRSVHLAVKDDETSKSAIAFLREAAAAFPCRLTHGLTDNGGCFSPAFAKVCAELGAEYRHTRPYSLQTSGMVERCNGRVGREVLGITIHSHQQLGNCTAASTPLTTAAVSGFSRARRPTRSSPNAAKPAVNSPTPSHRAEPDQTISPKHAASPRLSGRSHNRTAT